MQYPAQVQACIELLAVQLKNQSVADQLLYKYFRARRYIGSKDRTSITTLFYSILRQRLELEHYLGVLGIEVHAEHIVALGLSRDGQALSGVFTGDQYQPACLPDDVVAQIESQDLTQIEIPLHAQLNVPEWLMPYFQASFGDRMSQELAALNQPAPVDLRVNTLCATRDQVLKDLQNVGIEAQATLFSPVGIRLQERAAISGLDLFKQGAFEVQDEGSQLLAQICAAKPGHKVIDFCAGAGGKALALAAAMDNKGSIIACDISAPRLQELSKRAKRAGAFNIRTLELNHEHSKLLKRHIKTADVVLVDAPCSGSGAWRRNPDARFNLSDQRLLELTRLQSQILSSAARLVKPGGRLIYATCSLFTQENQYQIDAFLKENNDIYQLSNVGSTLDDASYAALLADSGQYLELSPARTNTDGFFAAVLLRAPEHN